MLKLAIRNIVLYKKLVFIHRPYMVGRLRVIEYLSTYPLVSGR